MVDPYAPPRPDELVPKPRHPAGHCQVCGVALAMSQRLFDEQGEVICQGCLSAKQVDEGHQKVALKIKGAAYAALGFGLISLVFNPFYFFSLAAFGNGLYAIRSFRDPEVQRRLEGSILGAKLALGAGMALGGLSLSLRLLLLF